MIQHAGRLLHNYLHCRINTFQVSVSTRLDYPVRLDTLAHVPLCYPALDRRTFLTSSRRVLRRKATFNFRSWKEKRQWGAVRQALPVRFIPRVDGRHAIRL